MSSLASRGHRPSEPVRSARPAPSGPPGLTARAPRFPSRRGAAGSPPSANPSDVTTALALALHLALASPGLDPVAMGTPTLAPRLDPGPFSRGELMLASAGTLAGDALVVGGGYLALTMFANGTLQPTAGNFRTTAYILAASAVLVPPLTAVLLARLGGRGPLAGAMWKAVLLAAAGEATALAAGYLAAPHFWVVLPVQLATVSLGTSLGLHWGPRGAGPMMAPQPAARGEPGDPAPAPSTASLFLPICPDV